MYMMGLGNKPIGECYLSPPSTNEETGSKEAWLIGHYYSGGNVKLIKFAEPLPTPEEGSPEKRMKDLEEFQHYMTNYTNIWLRLIYEFMIGTKTKADVLALYPEFQTYQEYVEYLKGMEAPPEEDNDDTAPTSTEDHYVITSAETYAKTRGWWGD